MVFFSSDAHLGHGNVAKFCKRYPWFKDEYVTELEDGNLKWVSQEIADICGHGMNEGLIYNWNSRVTDADTVFHLGDFCCKGREQGVDGCRLNAKHWESELNGKIIHIKGNHDVNNSVKGALESAVFRSKSLSFYMCHKPQDARPEDHKQVILCGHVHNRWKTRWIGSNLAINVGVDVNKYAPITLNEVITIYWRIINKAKEVPNAYYEDVL